MSCPGFAQKQSFDIVTYTAPQNWTGKAGDGNISYSRIDGGNWAQIAIYQHRSSEGDIQSDFDKDWNELVANGRAISAPDKTEPTSESGWTAMSGNGVWQYNGANVASMLTVYSNKKVCVAILCNATAMPYLKAYQTMLGSLDIAAADHPGSSNTNHTSLAAKGNGNAVVGLWSYNLLETSGYSNGFPQYTAGYSRSEYLLKEDGTYIYRAKSWMVYGAKNILFIYEVGTYSINGSQISFTPKQAKGGWWKKTSSTKEWGPFVSGLTDYKQERKVYNFEMKYYSGTNNTALILKTGNATGVQEISFTKRAANEPLIDNPPGFETGFEK
ncbi:hypothetical protein DCC81_05165 [Chitinophaga parva]|uniref:Uncharacterized protein n=2 Tax=Chitinophaga parva TaxID=2169414 RepID=A0A2T7BMM3_9BACT|nr:hypothetical protein DCC81_05165 [Chitinophaga parva]